MAGNTDHMEVLRSKQAKEESIKEKYLTKRKELDLKIKKCDENLKKINEDIENHEIDKTIKVIKTKGYSLAFIQEVIESGVLDSNQKNIIEEKEDEIC